jgi:hypothetical protein
MQTIKIGILYPSYNQDGGICGQNSGYGDQTSIYVQQWITQGYLRKPNITGHN